MYGTNGNDIFFNIETAQTREQVMTGHEWRNKKSPACHMAALKPPLECGPPRRHSTWYEKLTSSWVHLVPSTDHPQAHPYPPFLENLDWSRSISLSLRVVMRTIRLEWHDHDIKENDLIVILFS